MDQDPQIVNHQETVQHMDQDLPPLEAEELPLSRSDLHTQYISILQKVLPHMGKDQHKIVSALVMLALKLDGIIGKDLSPRDTKMVNTIKESILSNDDRLESALMVAERILKQSK
ncbi:hypothetical protein HOH87_02505 [bacterium]|jgi:hypothetical protein|nr:hypothetical protein [bacterium]